LRFVYPDLRWFQTGLTWPIKINRLICILHHFWLISLIFQFSIGRWFVEQIFLGKMFFYFLWLFVFLVWKLLCFIHYLFKAIYFANLIQARLIEMRKFIFTAFFNSAQILIMKYYFSMTLHSRINGFIFILFVFKICTFIFRIEIYHQITRFFGADWWKLILSRYVKHFFSVFYKVGYWIKIRFSFIFLNLYHFNFFIN